MRIRAAKSTRAFTYQNCLDRLSIKKVIAKSMIPHVKSCIQRSRIDVLISSWGGLNVKSLTFNMASATKFVSCALGIDSIFWNLFHKFKSQIVKVGVEGITKRVQAPTEEEL